MQVSDVVHNGWNIAADLPHFGIEIEVENASSPRGLHDTLWTTVADGSLRDSGVEFLSSRPFTRAEVEQQVPLFYRWMNEHQYTTGVRTSTHVHVNVLAFTTQQVAAACTVHALVEPILFRYCGPLREENIYCVPWYRAPDEMEHVRAMQSRIARVGNACKYASLFIEPVCRFGTLEFRHAPVFHSGEELLTWVDMCERIVYSGFDTPEEVMEAWRELGPLQFVEGLFGSRICGVLLGYVEMDFDELLELYDTESVAEQSCCTYNENRNVNGWEFPTFEVDGTGAVGYHRTPRYGSNPFPDWEPPEYDEYPEDEEYYDEEDY